VAVFESKRKRRYTASNFLFRLRPKAEVDPHYLAFILGSPPVRERVADSVKTMTYPNLSYRIYSEIEIPLLPLSDQQAVARFFTALLNGQPLPELPGYLAEQRRIVARIEELAAKVAEARGLREKASQEAAALVISIHKTQSGDRIRKLSDLLKLEEDQVNILATEHYPQVGMKGFGGGLFAKPAVAGCDTTYKRFNRLFEGAIVLSQVKAWEGAIAVCGENLAGWFVSPEDRTFRCNFAEARPGYLSAIVRTEWFWRRLKDATRGVGARRERTRPEQFLRIELPMPTVERQAQCEAVFSGLDALKRLQSETAAELDALLPSILDRAFKGEL
jgi:type I restriction enzyme S subunit